MPVRQPAIPAGLSGALLCAAACLAAGLSGCNGATSAGVQGNGRPQNIVSEPPVPVECLAFRPDGQALAASFDATVKVWDAGDGHEALTLRAPAQVTQLAYRPDGKVLATGCFNKTVQLWDAAGGAQQRELTGHRSPLTAVAWSADGRLLATAAGDPNPFIDHSSNVRSEVKLWDPGDGRLLADLAGAPDVVQSLAFSPDGGVLVAGSRDGHCKVWDVPTYVKRQTEPEHGRGGVTCVAFSRDGKLLATGGFDQVIKLWDAATWQEQAQLTGHEGRVNAVAFSPSGALLASVSDDGTVRLWDVARRSARTLAGPGRRVLCAAFGAEATLATGGTEGVVRVWDTTQARERLTLH
jgi:WD40 repeat protein